LAFPFFPSSPHPPPPLPSPYPTRLMTAKREQVPIPSSFPLIFFPPPFAVGPDKKSSRKLRRINPFSFFLPPPSQILFSPLTPKVDSRAIFPSGPPFSPSPPFQRSRGTFPSPFLPSRPPLFPFQGIEPFHSFPSLPASPSEKIKGKRKFSPQSFPLNPTYLKVEIWCRIPSPFPFPFPGLTFTRFSPRVVRKVTPFFFFLFCFQGQRRNKASRASRGVFLSLFLPVLSPPPPLSFPLR